MRLSKWFIAVVREQKGWQKIKREEKSYSTKWNTRRILEGYDPTKVKHGMFASLAVPGIKLMPQKTDGERGREREGTADCCEREGEPKHPHDKLK